MTKKDKNAKLDALMQLAGIENLDIKVKEYIPTGHTELDYVISCGTYPDENLADATVFGLPTGVIAMIYGGEGGGKSSLAYRICGNAQRMGKIPFWIDAENSFSPQLALINGVDITSLVPMKLWDSNNPEKIYDAEGILDKIQEACKAGAGVVVLDSIAALVPRYIMENPAEKDTMGALARVLSKTLNKIASFAAANNTLVIFINQLREKIGVSFGNPETTTGGHALRHMCSVILKVNKLTSKDSYHFVENSDGEEEMIAGSANVYIEKNRFSMPYKKAVTVPIYYKYYFPNAEEVVFQYGRKTKVISVRNGFFSFDKIKGANPGKNSFMEALKESGSINSLVESIVESASEMSIPLPPEIVNFKKHEEYQKDNKVYQGEENNSEDKKTDTKENKSKKKKKTEPVDENPEI